MYQRAIFWFRQDLRVFDNIWLWKALENAWEVIPVFVFDENILSRFPKNDKRLWFLKNALLKLESNLYKKWSYLVALNWDPVQEIPKAVDQYNADAVFTNNSYWEYWVQRDKKIKETIKADFQKFEDFFLVDPFKVPVRKVFTPFYKQWKPLINFQGFYEVDSKINSSKSIEYTSVSWYFEKNFVPENNFWDIDYPQKILADYNFCNYPNIRDYPSDDGTSKLSPYIRFWIVSVREIYNSIQKSNCDNETFLSEIAWREFWNHIAINFPWSRHTEFLEKRRWIHWDNDKDLFEAWQEWKTWYPIVDAWMRQLKEENRIHNRIRMVVASFLTKDLLIDRRWWERHFENYLIDYDRNVNIWNWQWSASVGADPKPLRIFNPMIQSQKFDPDCNYIKKYIPELRDYEPGQIHNPLRYNLNYAYPVVDHYENSKKAKQAYMLAGW